MRKINILVSIILLALSVSCNRKMEFEHETFISLYGDKISVNEDAGEIKIPVSLYNPTGDEVQVTVSITDGKAENGTDFEVISPAVGVMTFAGDMAAQDIVIAITDNTGNLTGSKDFTIEIASATPGVDVGDVNKTIVTIKDLDHPLDKLFVGEWTGVAIYADETGTPFDMNVTIMPDDEDPTYKSVYVTDLDPYFAVNGLNSSIGMQIFKATANEDNTKLIIKSNQQTADVQGTATYISGSPNEGFVQPGGANRDIIIQLNDDKTLTIVNGYGTLDAGGWWSFYYGGTVLTRAK